MKTLRISSFKTKLVISVCMVNALVILLVSSISNQWFSSQMVSLTTAQTQLIIEQIGTNVSTYMNELYRLTLAPYHNDSVMQELEKMPEDSQGKLASKRIIEGFLSSVMTLPRSEILRVYVMSEGGLYSYTRTPFEMPDYNTYKESEWYIEAKSTTKPIFIPPQLERVFGEKKTPVFSVVRQLRNKDDNSITCGVIKVDADYTGIRKICENVDLKSGGILLIANAQNQILYQSSKLPEDLSIEQININLTNSTIDTSREYLVNTHSLPTYGMRIIAVHSYNELMRPMFENLIRTIALSATCIIITGIFFICIIRKFLKPLFEIIGLMKQVEGGNLNVRAQAKTDDEMRYLADSFNHMVGNLDETLKRNAQLVTEVYQAQYLTKEAQYDALCSQIKPHFLYNTLNTISLLIKCDECDSAIEAIEDLSLYLGGIMNVDREISVRQELDICEAYLNIVQMRYQDRLRYSIEVDDTLMNQSIPSLSLQSLVENAVKYSCEPRREETMISVFSIDDGSSFQLVVKDNGAGIGEEKLRKIRDSFTAVDDTSSSDESPLLGNIGLVNIYRRLHLKAGDRAHLLIESSKETGTEVAICLPKDLNEMED